MEDNKHAINSEATERVFDKYGGASSWLEACYQKGRPTDEEQECYDKISMAVLMQAMEQRPILNEEQAEVYESIESGLNFGMLVLSYNLLRGPDSLDSNIVNHALEYLSNKCAAYVDDVGAELSNPGLHAYESEEEGIGYSPRISNYLPIVDQYIDKVCPNVSLQNEFRQGAIMAESVFFLAMELTSYAKKVQLESQFEAIVSGLNLD